MTEERDRAAQVAVSSSDHKHPPMIARKMGKGRRRLTGREVEGALKTGSSDSRV